MHAIFASHVDQKKNLTVTYEGECLLQLSYHCQCDNLVVESPFTTSVHSFSVFVLKQYEAFTSSQYCTIPVDADRFSFLLRGPPCAV